MARSSVQTMSADGLDHPDDAGLPSPVVAFRVGSVNLGIDVRLVHEVVRAVPVTIPFPGDGRVAGWTTLRGQTVAVLDGHRLLGIPGSESSSGSRLIVLKHPSVCLLVDAVDGLHTVGASEGESSIDLAGSNNAPWIHSVTRTENGHHLGILDIDVLLAIAGDWEPSAKEAIDG